MASSKKFNKTKSASGEDKSRAWWPIKQFRLECSKHPVVLSKDRCASKISSLLSQQEEEMLEGLATSLQVDRREAVRIALQDLPTDARLPIDRAKATSSMRGHTARSRRLTINLPKSEKDRVVEVAQILELSEQEVVRLAIIWLQQGIRSETVTPTACKRISQKELSKEWQKQNQGWSGGSKLSALKEAGQRAFDQRRREHEEWQEAEYKLNGQYLEALRDDRQMFDWKTGEVNWAYIEMQKVIDHEEWPEKESEKTGLHPCYLDPIFAHLTDDEIARMVTEEEAEKKEARDFNERFNEIAQMLREQNGMEPDFSEILEALEAL